MANHGHDIFESYGKSVMATYFQVLFSNTTNLQYQAPNCLDKHDNHMHVTTAIDKVKVKHHHQVHVCSVMWQQVIMAASTCNNSKIILNT